MKKIISFLFIFAIVFQQSLWAQTKPAALMFEAKKNNVQVLPQRFEYSVFDDGTLKIGDIVINPSDVFFNLSTDPETQKIQLNFRWPAALLTDGEIAIKNAVGKAVWSQSFTKPQIQIKKTSEDKNSSLRNESALLSIALDDEQLLNELKFSPFINFCVYRESDETKIYLCSQELYFSLKDSPANILPRQNPLKTAQAEINGKTVGQQGIIFMNKSTDTVSFRAWSPTGGFIEIETKRKDVDFIDVIQSEEPNKIIIHARGAEPVDSTATEFLNNNEWKKSLDIDRPFFYLKGEGDIPLRQEFFIKGNLPRESHRILILEGSKIDKTYSSSAELKIATPSSGLLKPIDKSSTLSIVSTTETRWKINQLNPRKTNRRYLSYKVDNGQQTDQFTLFNDIYRGGPWDVSLGISSPFSSQGSFGTLEKEQAQFLSSYISLHYWLEYQLRFGLALESEQRTLKIHETEIKESTQSLQFLYRLTPGMINLDETHGVLVGYEMFQLESESQGAILIGLFSQKKSLFLKKWIDWMHFKLIATPQVKIQWTNISYLNSTLYFSNGIEYKNRKTQKPAEYELSELNFQLGMGLQF